MTLDERRLAVGILFSLTIALRLLVMVQAQGWKHGDGIRREGWLQGVVLRLWIVVVGLGGTLLFVVAPDALPLPLDPPAGLLAAALVAAEAGLVLLFWVHLALGRNFSGTLHLQDDHRLVQEGPYRWIRHPMYTSFLLLLGGIAALVADGLVSTTILASQVWTIGIRLRDEEAMLAERFGDQWQLFRARTGAILPRLW